MVFSPRLCRLFRGQGFIPNVQFLANLLARLMA
jgi:hypothetical protein